MLKQMNVLKTIVGIAVLAASGAVAGNALAREDAPKKAPEQSVLAQDQGNQLVLHVGSYKSGEVPKQVLINSAESEAARPNQDKNSGSARTQSSSRVPTFAFYGK
jgi:hypothetical protein